MSFGERRGKLIFSLFIIGKNSLKKTPKIDIILDIGLLRPFAREERLSKIILLYKGRWKNE